MAKQFNIEITEDRTQEILDNLDEIAKTALEACGIQAETHAVDYITAQGAIDTGLLRNSITSAIGGEKANKGEYAGDKEKDGKIPKGKYTGTAPKDEKYTYTMYLGSNVYYAPLTRQAERYGDVL